MKILLVGNGGREHALAYSIAKSPQTEKLFIAPGNGGTAELGTNVDIKADDIEGLLSFAKKEKIDLTMVGPEVSLCLGIVDKFKSEGLRIVGPNKEAAQLEGSKIYAKEFMTEMGIPTARYLKTSDYEVAVEGIKEFDYPVVIKADGLAAGKGVVIPTTYEEAVNELKEIMLDKKFGSSGDSVLIEEFLTGTEASLICITDGNTIIPLESARDYKRAKDGDEGLNTGGMGSFSPNPVLDEPLLEKAKEKILKPFIEGLKKRNLEFVGILFVGLMIENDDVNVIEFNVRFGDPETQVILPRLKSDIVEVFDKMIDKKLDTVTLEWSDKPCMSVVVASGGYPEDYGTGYEIKGLSNVEDAIIFHGGTKRDGDKVLTSGGRVLNVVASGESLEKCRESVYDNVKKLDFEGIYYRTDIGKNIR